MDKLGLSIKIGEEKYFKRTAMLPILEPFQQLTGKPNWEPMLDS